MKSGDINRVSRYLYTCITQVMQATFAADCPSGVRFLVRARAVLFFLKLEQLAKTKFEESGMELRSRQCTAYRVNLFTARY